MSKKFLLIVALGVLILCGQTALACSCFGGGLPCQAYGNTDVVFIGTATEVTRTSVKQKVGEREYDFTRRVFTFRIEEAFRGIDLTEVQIRTGQGGGDCGYDFRIGEHYLVYAGLDADKKNYTTSICTRTRPISEATEDLDYIRSLPTLSRGAVLSGEISRFRRNLETEQNQQLGPMSDIEILIEGGGKSLKVRTDERGQYRTTGLGPGKYKVTPLLPEKLSTYDLHQEIVLTERGCGFVRFAVTDNGRISGRVFDADGKAVPRMMLTLIPVSQASSERPRSMYNSADEEGRFELKFVPPGQYLLGIRLNGLGSPSDPEKAFPRSYYPGVAVAAEAMLINLGEGEVMNDLEFRLSPRLAERTISGKVVWPDGRPAPHAMVAQYEAAYQPRSVGHAMPADADGRFRFAGYEGIAVYVSATAGDGKGRQMHAEPVDIPPTGTVENVVLVISEPNGTCRRCLNYRYGQNQRKRQ